MYIIQHMLCVSPALYFQALFVNDEYSIQFTELKEMTEVSKLS